MGCQPSTEKNSVTLRYNFRIEVRKWQMWLFIFTSLLYIGIAESVYSISTFSDFFCFLQLLNFQTRLQGLFRHFKFLHFFKKNTVIPRIYNSAKCLFKGCPRRPFVKVQFWKLLPCRWKPIKSINWGVVKTVFQRQ